MTAVAVAMAGDIVAVTPRRAGRWLAPGNACAVFESGKSVRPAKVAFAAERPAVAHMDPSEHLGWSLCGRDDWKTAKARLTPGHAVAEPYLELMREDNFDRCDR